MMTIFERMLQEQRAMSEVAAIERLVQRNGKFNGKNMSRYLRDYKAEMWREIIRVASDILQSGGYYHRHTNHGLGWSTDNEAMTDKATDVELEVTRLGTLEAGSDKNMNSRRCELLTLTP